MRAQVHCFIMFSVFFFFSLIPLFLILPSFGLLEFFLISLVFLSLEVFALCLQYLLWVLQYTRDWPWCIGIRILSCGLKCGNLTSISVCLPTFFPHSLKSFLSIRWCYTLFKSLSVICKTHYDKDSLLYVPTFLRYSSFLSVPGFSFFVSFILKCLYFPFIPEG